ncbi:hypothetical protein [Paramicrobacterium fandaimingii]|uniref:hypothetical protein n=1 Tax=Paramicrobacterium fandaimingii TaxID=2708079 RepID=UPI001422EDFD|nr:hypothetical protein [Microbacterium fandaimingii]
MKQDFASTVYNARVGHEKFHDLNELRAFTERLIQLWDRDHDRPFKMKSEYAVGSGPLIWSFTQHVVELTRTILDLSRQNRMIIAVPLIRLSVENTMTSVWAYLVPDSAKAVVFEGLRNKKNTIAGIIKQNAEGFDAESLGKAQAELSEFEEYRLPAAQNFQQLCDQILGGTGIKLSWRVMSSYSHAQMPMADFYLNEVPKTDDMPLGIEFNPDATLKSHEAWLGTSICMLITSMKVCDSINQEGRHKTQLGRAAKMMGISLDLKLANEQK